ncbi:MAG: hypothetical protein AAF821_23240 [Cyanobacteria bacterium P01_D01_bin.156]
MDSWLYIVKIAIASAILSALIKWVGPMVEPPESIALILVLLPTTVLAGVLLLRLRQS